MDGAWEEVQDALAAFETAAALEGVDPAWMVGADGAPDGCWLFNQAHGAGCLGAFSWSPGSYLGMDYAETVRSLNLAEPSVPVWCLAADGDGESFAACESAAKSLDGEFIYRDSSAHGMFLIDPDLTPGEAPDQNSLELLLAFIEILGLMP